jgi:mono/diheme cytochrome c family protein
MDASLPRLPAVVVTVSALLTIFALAPEPTGNCGPVPAGSSLGATSGDTAVEGPLDDKTTKSSTTTPIQVYRASCLECHDVDGRGSVTRESVPQLPDFTDAKWQSSKSDAVLTRSILEGKGKLMPKMKKKLGSLDVAAMVAFVRGFKDGKQVVEEEPAVASESEKSGERSTTSASDPRSATASVADRSNPAQRGMNKDFQRFCAMCHGGKGDGSNARDTMKAIPNFTSPAWHSKRTDPQLTVSILDGKGTEMPSFRSKLTRDQARELVAFVRGFSPTTNRPTRARSDDFDVRFRKLEQELEELRRQSRALASPAPSAPAAPAAKDTKP